MLHTHSYKRENTQLVWEPEKDFLSPFGLEPFSFSCFIFIQRVVKLFFFPSCAVETSQYNAT